MSRRGLQPGILIVVLIFSQGAIRNARRSHSRNSCKAAGRGYSERTGIADPSRSRYARCACVTGGSGRHSGGRTGSSGGSKG